MNIGVDIRCLMEKNRTGVGEYTFGLLNAVFSMDKENQYFLFYNSNKDVSANLPDWEQNNVHLLASRWPNKLFNLFLYLKIIKLDKLVIKNYFKISNFKLEIDYWLSPNLNFTNLSKKTRYIQTIHDLSFEFFPECFTRKQRLWHWFLQPSKQCQRADIILVPSKNTKQDVQNKYGVESEKVKVLRPGIEKEEGNEITEQTRIKYILFLGTLEPRKNIESIIEAYKLSAVNYQLVIAGASGWKNKRTLALIQNTPGVEYLGYVTKEEKITLYKQASLFVFPSLYEGFGLPVMEAMAYGVPVVTSNCSSLPEVVGEAGYLVHPYNIAEIAEAMKKVLSDNKLRDMLMESGNKKIVEFKWEKTARVFLDLL